MRALMCCVLVGAASCASEAAQVRGDFSLLYFQNLPVLKTTSDKLEVYSQEALSLEASELPVWAPLKGRIGLQMERLDLNSITLLDKDQKPLAREQRYETSLSTEVEASYLKGDWDARMGIFFPLVRGLQSQRGIYSNLRRGLFFQSTWIGLDSTLLEQKNPLNYFIDRDLKTKARPEKVQGFELGTSWEQIYSESWKSKLRLSMRTLKEERPLAFGAELFQVFALNPRLFVSPQLSYFRESQSTELKNERGYFSALSGKVEVGVEPIYDWILGLSYALSVEREDDPRVFKLDQVGADQWALSLLYQSRRGQFRLQAQSLASNRGHKNYALSGGVTWQL